MKGKRLLFVWSVSLIVIGVLSGIQSVNQIIISINGSGFLPDILVRAIGVCQIAAAAVLVFTSVRRVMEKNNKGA